MKIIVVLILLVIVGSLGSALYYLLKDRGERSPRTVKALTFRIGLSIGLFLLLLLAYGTGLIKPHGLRPGLGALGGRLPSAPAGQPAQPANPPPSR